MEVKGSKLNCKTMKAYESAAQQLVRKAATFASKPYPTTTTDLNQVVVVVVIVVVVVVVVVVAVV